jgi:hypothetical protein
MCLGFPELVKGFYIFLLFFFLNCIGSVRFKILTAASMKMTVLWYVAPYSLVEVYRHDYGGNKHL